MVGTRTYGLVALVCAVALVVGAGGFSSVDAARDVAVSVVGDDSAYVEVRLCETSDPDRVNVTVWNRFTESVKVVSVNGDSLATKPTIPAGENESFEVSLAADNDVPVTVEGDHVEATVTRDVQQC